jgi:general secretion pathway protein D
MNSTNSTTRPAVNLALLALPWVLAGCAGAPVQQGTLATSGKGGAQAIVPAPEVQAQAKSNEDDRYKIYPGTGMTIKGVVRNPMKLRGGNMSLNFEGADIREVVRTILGDILKENYIVDPRVAGTIVLRTVAPIPQSSAMSTLEEVLRMNGAALIREADGMLHVVPASLAGRGNVSPQLGGPDSPLPPGYSIQVVQLSYMGAPEMMKILEAFSEPGTVRADPVRNLLILAGTQTQLRHIMDTIEMFDMDWMSGMSVGLFTFRNVDVKSIMTDVDKLFGPKNDAPWNGAIRVIPIERLNALLVVSPQVDYLEKARTWIERLDRGSDAGGGTRLYVYPLQNGKAELMADLLNDAFSKQKSTNKAATLAPGVKPAEVVSDAAKTQAPARIEARSGVEVSDGIRVIADKDNNALLILASAAQYESIESAVRQLDVVPRQVLIEVTIAEVTLKDELKYGLEWFFNSGRTSGKLDTGASGVTQLVPGFSAVFTGKAGDVRGVLNALATDQKLKVLSAPHVTVADNQTAKIQVGDRVPTISQTQTATNTTNGIISTVQYIETGVLLSVTPRINSGGLVTMEVNQEVSNATANTTSGIDSPTIQKRAAQSTVTIQSGQTLVLAGLIREEKNNASEGLPGLASLPLLGGLFGSRSSSENRTELVILITPQVMDSQHKAAEITKEFRKRVGNLEKMMKESHDRGGYRWAPLDVSKDASQGASLHDAQRN